MEKYLDPFDKIADKYQALHSSNPHQRRIVERLVELMPRRASILDLGCGTGVPTARQLVEADCSVTGVDISDKMLELARINVPKATFIRSDFRLLPSDTGPFSAITAFFSLLMLTRAEIDEVLGKIFRWIVPGGYFAIGMVDFEGDAVPIDFLGTTFCVSGFGRDELGTRIASVGFKIVSIESVEYQIKGEDSEKQIFGICQRPGG